MVTSPSDNVDGSLRTALSLSSANDTIRFNISGDTVVLEKEIGIFKDIVLLGANSATGNRVIIQVSRPGVSAYRVFTIGGYSDPTKEVEISTPYVILRDAVLRGGQPASGNGGVISLTGNLIADNVVVSDGVAVSGSGGGIAINSRGDLTLNNCTISGNSATMYKSNTTETASAFGGGIYTNGGRLSITNCTITKNICEASGANTLGEVVVAGGGIFASNTRLFITNSTIADNRCLAIGTSDTAVITTNADGGGIFCYSEYLTMVNSSIVKNTAEANSKASYPRAFAHGGGLYTGGQLSLAHCTILDNASISRHSNEKSSFNVNASAGGIYSGVGVFIVNCIMANNTFTTGTAISTEDVYNVTPGRALYSIVDTCTNTSLVNCLVRQTIQKIFGSAIPGLANNGGSTQTVLLPTNSVAIGAGIKTALFYRDTMMSTRDSVPEITYLSGTSWLVLKTNAPVPEGKKVSPIDFDQRGQTRPAMPCIGAFEYTLPVNTVPDIPITISPVSAAINQSLASRLIWHAAQRASSYHVQVSLKADFTIMVKDTSGITDTSLVLSGLAPDTRYYWCIAAVNSAGTSRWSTTMYFNSIQSIQSIPLQAILIYPPDKAKIETDSVLLVWKTGTPAVDRYMVEVATDSAMSHLFFIDSTKADTIKHIAGLSGGVTCWWRVKAHNAIGWGPFSQKQCLTYSSSGVFLKAAGINTFTCKEIAGRIVYTLAKRCFVRFTIVDLQGKTVGSFINQTQNPGCYTFYSRLSQIPKGSYVQIFSAGDFVRKNTIVILR